MTATMTGYDGSSLISSYAHPRHKRLTGRPVITRHAHRPDCRAKWSGDHEFESVDDNRRHQTPPPGELRALVASSGSDA